MGSGGEMIWFGMFRRNGLFLLDCRSIYLFCIYSHSIFAFSVKSFRLNIINGLDQIGSVTYMYKDPRYNYLDIRVSSYLRSRIWITLGGIPMNI